MPLGLPSPSSKISPTAGEGLTAAALKAASASAPNRDRRQSFAPSDDKDGDVLTSSRRRGSTSQDKDDRTMSITLAHRRPSFRAGEDGEHEELSRRVGRTSFGRSDSNSNLNANAAHRRGSFQEPTSVKRALSSDRNSAGNSSFNQQQALNSSRRPSLQRGNSSGNLAAAAGFVQKNEPAGQEARARAISEREELARMKVAPAPAAGTMMAQGKMPSSRPKIAKSPSSSSLSASNKDGGKAGLQLKQEEGSNGPVVYTGAPGRPPLFRTLCRIL